MNYETLIKENLNNDEEIKAVCLTKWGPLHPSNSLVSYVTGTYCVLALTNKRIIFQSLDALFKPTRLDSYSLAEINRAEVKNYLIARKLLLLEFKDSSVYHVFVKPFAMGITNQRKNLKTIIDYLKIQKYYK